uniref:V-SNARE coiled-coil homology domain-containing protein n=1 Tax=Anas platyrhynchos platyrhynchos TaxID=8840 RepID=U3I3H1_ANAPP
MSSRSPCPQGAEEVTELMKQNFAKALEREGRLSDLDNRAQELRAMVGTGTWGHVGHMAWGDVTGTLWGHPIRGGGSEIMGVGSEIICPYCPYNVPPPRP